MPQMEVTWWAGDGSERRGRVCVAPNASPETAAALAAMMRLAASEASRAESGSDTLKTADVTEIGGER